MADVLTPVGSTTITDADILVTWDNTGISLPMIGYSITVYETADSGNILYQTGLVLKPVTSHRIPAGELPSGEIVTFSVTIFTAQGQTDASDADNVTLDFDAAQKVTALTAVPVANPDPSILPHIRLEWGEPSGGYIGGSALAHHIIMRRNSNEVTYFPGVNVEAVLWKPIAWIDAADESQQPFSQYNYFQDFDTQPGESYQYKVVSVIYGDDAAGFPLLVAETAATQPVTLEFEHCFIHTTSQYKVDNPRFVRFETWDHNRSLQFNSSTRNMAGRATPVVSFGEQRASRININGLDQLRTDKVLLSRLEDLLDGQQNDAYMLCLRFGKDKEMYFGSITSVDERANQVTDAVNITFQESFYDTRLSLDDLNFWRRYR